MNWIQEINEAEGMHCDIYRAKDYRTSNAVQGTKVLLIASEDVPNVPEIFSADDDTPKVVIVKKTACGREFYKAILVSDAVQGNERRPFGGSFIYTSDSRFPFDHPVKLHDYTGT